MVAPLSVVFLPNRIEFDQTGRDYCVDLYCVPGWKSDAMEFLGRELRVARNPHSAVLVLSREKLALAAGAIDTTFRGVIIAKELESAVAHFHSPFQMSRLFRMKSSTSYITWTNSRARSILLM